MDLFLNKKSGRSPSSTTPPVKGCTPICVPARQNPGRAIKVRNHAGQSAGCIPAMGCSANEIGIVSNSGYRYPHIIPTGCGEMKDIYRIRPPTGPLANAIKRSGFAEIRSIYIWIYRISPIQLFQPVVWLRLLPFIQDTLTNTNQYSTTEIQRLSIR